jgi:hypothetical protein
LNRLVAYFLVCLVIISVACERIYRAPLTGLYHTDFGVYFRKIMNPDLFRWSLPAVWETFERTPTWFEAVAATLLNFGFDPLSPFHQGFAISFSIVVQISLFAAASWHISRALGANRSTAVVGVILALLAPLVSTHGRFYSVNSATSDAYISFLAVGGACLSLSLFVRGRVVAAALIAGFVTNFHAASGPLAVLVMGVATVFDANHQSLRRRLSRLSLVFGLAGLFAAPAVIRVLFSDVPWGGSGYDKELFMSYAFHRSANPFPQREGISAVIIQICMMSIPLLFARSIAVQTRYHQVESLRLVALTLMLLYLLQIFATEVLGSVFATTLLFHRISTWSFVAGASVLAMALVSCIRDFRQSPLKFWVLLYLATLLFYSLGGRLLPAKFFTVEAWSLVVLPVLGSLSFLILGQRTKTAALIVMGVAILISVLLEVFFGAPAHEEMLWSYPAVYPLFVGIAVALMIGFLRDRLDLRMLLGLVAVSLLFGRSLPPLALAHSEERLKVPFIPLPDKQAHLFDFVVEHSEPNDVLMVLAPLDVVGFRRQFLDWKHEWYTLYSKHDLESLKLRMEAIGMDISSTSPAIKKCQFPNWLLRSRCVSTDPFNLAKLEDTFGVVDRWQAMKAAEPRLNLLVVPNDRRIPLTYIPGAEVVAESEKFQMLKVR